jgi:hypothetical protein
MNNFWTTTADDTTTQRLTFDVMQDMLSKVDSIMEDCIVEVIANDMTIVKLRHILRIRCLFTGFKTPEKWNTVWFLGVAIREKDIVPDDLLLCKWKYGGFTVISLEDKRGT